MSRHPPAEEGSGREADCLRRHHHEDAGRAARLGSARLGSARLGSARLGSARLGSARLGSARLGSARLGSARLGSARLGSARLGSARQDYTTRALPECQAKSAVYGSPVAPGGRGSINVPVHDGCTPSRRSVSFGPTTATYISPKYHTARRQRSLTGTHPAPAGPRRIHPGKALPAVVPASRPDCRAATQPARRARPPQAFRRVRGGPGPGTSAAARRGGPRPASQPSEATT